MQYSLAFWAFLPQYDSYLGQWTETLNSTFCIMWGECVGQYAECGCTKRGTFVTSPHFSGWPQGCMQGAQVFWGWTRCHLNDSPSLNHWITPKNQSCWNRVKVIPGHCSVWLLSKSQWYHLWPWTMTTNITKHKAMVKTTEAHGTERQHQHRGAEIWNSTCRSTGCLMSQ